jgi:hypothetical protein
MRKIRVERKFMLRMIDRMIILRFVIYIHNRSILLSNSGWGVIDFIINCDFGNLGKKLGKLWG